MSTNNLFVPVTPDITELKTGTPVIKYGGRYIVAGIGGDYIPSGIGAKPRGEWDSTTQYKERDAVTYQGQLYIAIKATVGVAPDESADWLCYVQRGATGEPLEANYIDVTEVTDGYLVLPNDTIPVSVEVEGKVFNVEDVVSEGDTFKIPVDPILANANIESPNELTWRVWRAGGKEGPVGPQGPPGAVSFEELTEEQKESLKGDKGDTGPEGPQGPQGPQGIQGLQGDQGPQGPAGDPLEANYIDVTEVTDGYLVLPNDTIPVSVEVDGKVFTIRQIVSEADAFKIPVDPILAELDILNYSGTWRVWRAGGKEGLSGHTPVRGTDYWTDTDIAEIKAYVDDAILNGEW